MIKAYKAVVFKVKDDPVAKTWSLVQSDGTTPIAAYADNLYEMEERRVQEVKHDNTTNLQTASVTGRRHDEDFANFLDATDPAVAQTGSTEDWVQDDGTKRSSATAGKEPVFVVQVFGINNENTKYYTNCMFGYRSNSARDLALQGDKDSEMVVPFDPAQLPSDYNDFVVPALAVPETLLDSASFDATIKAGTNFVTKYQPKAV